MREDILMSFLCPVCGFDALEEPPRDFTICPCCGTEFGYDDFGPDADGIARRQHELRWQWLEQGAPWFDVETAPAEGWDIHRAFDQVLKAGLWTWAPRR